MAKKDDKLNYKQLSAELKAKGPERLYILHGEEDYLLESFVRELTAACLPRGRDDSASASSPASSSPCSSWPTA